MNTKNLEFNSKLIHAGDFYDEFGSAVMPIYQTSTFSFRNSQHGADLFAGKEKGYIYTRIGNPTIEALENKLAELENGYRGIALSSGMAAVSTVYTALLCQGDHMISTSAVYGSSRGVMESFFSKFGVEYSYIDTSDTKAIQKNIKPNTKLLYLETPANPTLCISDIKKASELAHKHNIIVVVDNTFCSPYLQKPLDLGADVVLHSLTKFINGHTDVVGGALITALEDIYNNLRKAMVYLGGNMDPHQAFMINRGVKTLALRIERAQENAMKIAKFLKIHPKVEWIKYPGLKSFPQYKLMKEQMKGPGSIICFGLKDGFEAGKVLMNNVRLATLAVSLGGVETLIQHPASMTHAGISKEDRLAAYITDEMIRYSVGIENAEDLINDLDQALAKI